MKKTLLAAGVIVAVAGLGTAGWYLGRDLAQRDAGGAALLSYIPADTPYVVASTERMPEAQVAAWQAQSAAAFEYYALSLEDLAAATAAGAGKDGADPAEAEGMAAVRAVIDELAAASREGRLGALLGVDVDADYAFYGQGLLPTLRVQTVDPEATRAFIASIEQRAGSPLPTTTVQGREVWQVAGAANEPSLVAGLLDGWLVVALAPPAADEATLAGLLGLTAPANPMSGDDRLAALRQTYGFTSDVAGYVDLRRIAGIVSGASRGPLDAALLADVPVMDATCQAEIASLAEAWPRMAVGVTSMDGRTQRSLGILEVRSDIAADLAGLSIAYPGGPASDASAGLDVGMALDMAKIAGTVSKWSGAFASAPYQCGELAGINTAMGQMQQGTASLAMAGALGHGLRMQISDMEIDLASGAPPRFSGRVVVASNSPQGLLGMASMQMPALASAGLAPGAGVKAIEGGLPGIEGPVFAAMGERALAMSIGEGQEAGLEALLATDPADTRVLGYAVNGEDYARLMGSMNQVQQAAMAMPGADPAREARKAELMGEMMRASFERMETNLRFTARGIEMDATVVLPAAE